jgi:hypothetical protein
MVFNATFNNISVLSCLSLIDEGNWRKPLACHKSSDFLQDLVCNGRSVCSKGCVCFEQNLSCTELCPCQALDLCHNVITHRTDIEDENV